MQPSICRRLRSLVFLSICAGLLVVTPAAVAQDVTYEQTSMVPDGVGNDKRWTAIEDGHISFKSENGDYSAEFTWTPPPQSFGPEGFDMTLTVKANATPSRLTAGTGLSGTGFSFDKNPPGVEVFADMNESKSGSISIHISPTGSAEGEVIELHPGAYFGPGVTYKYVRKVSGTGEGEDGEDDDDADDTGDDDEPVTNLDASLDCPDTIIISEEPPLNCHIIITGYVRNSSYPVIVELPQGIDFFVNHTNGLQLIDAVGENDPYNWEDRYAWGFFLFACPGVNCFGRAAVPGIPVTVPIRVQQKDQIAEVMLQITPLANPNNPSTSSGAGNAVIGNLASGDVLLVVNGTPSMGLLNLQPGAANWSIEPVAGTNFIRFRSIDLPGTFLTISGDSAVAAADAPGTANQMWEIVPVPGTDLVNIRSAASPDLLLFATRGRIVVGQNDPGIEEALWWIMR